MKLELLQKEVREKSAFLIKNPLTRFYLTGFQSSAGTLLVTRNTILLIIDFRYYEMAKKAVQGISIELLTNESKQLSAILQREEIEKIYVETNYVSVDLFHSLKNSVPEVRFATSDWLVRVLNELRICKTPQEIDKIRACQQVTDETFTYMLSQIEMGVSERELAFRLDTHMRKLGADGPSFDTIVLSGSNTSYPHGSPGERCVQAGDFVLMDFGVYMDGYCSDMTRTVAVSTVSDRQRLVYDTVLEAKQRALALIAPGVSCKSIDFAARDYIENKCGFAGRFGHGLGHGVGVEIHELPTFSPNSLTVLEPGMVITVEPGIYLEDEFGVRIEDFVVITDDGYEKFTKSPHDLIVL